MKKNLLLIALLGISAAWINRPAPSAPPTMHNYNFRYLSTDGTKMYYGKDLTNIGYIKGFDYICLSAAYNCTFIAQPALSHTDLSGNYFFTWDVPTSGIDGSGFYYEF